MDVFASLWLPIILSGIFAFIVSSITHMALPLHRGDFRKLPDEQGILEVMRNNLIRPGTYMFPHATSIKDYNSPEMIEKFKEGPVGIVHISSRTTPGMGKELLMWFLFLLLIGIFVAYIAAITLGRGADAVLVFRVTGATALIAHITPAIYESVWKSQRWGISVKFILEGILYALVTGATFAWLWPAA